MNDPIMDGVKLLFIGMGTVVVFLFLMIGCMRGLLKLIKPIEMILDPKESPRAKASTSTPKENVKAVNGSELCAATLAVLGFFKKNGGQMPINSICVAKLNGREYEVKSVGGEKFLVDGHEVDISSRTTAAGSAAPSAASAEPVAPKKIEAAEPVEIHSPLPGTIVKINVTPGDHVAAGSEIIVIEAMKMETPIRLEKNARVISVMVSEKEVVGAGQTLIIVEEN